MTSFAAATSKEVVFVTRILTHYRVPFHERVRSLLAENTVKYRLITGQPTLNEAKKGDLGNLSWAEEIQNKALLGLEKLTWQPIMKKISSSDLVIIGQENKHIVNYPLQIARKPNRKIALFGHGRNFQSRAPGGPAERWRRFWATKCDWWFGYTEETRQCIEALGFPAQRITVFNNAVDTSALRAIADDIAPDEVSAASLALGAKGNNIAIFVGGLYADKRLDFLVAAADKVRARIPDFELVVVGGGEDMPRMQQLAARRRWLFIAGPRFGREKAALMLGAKLFLMPGLVGLAVLDAAALGLPVVTTAWPWHSPEIAYLQDEVNGVIVPQWQDTSAYATEIVRLLNDEAARTRLTEAARATAARYTIDAMAERFASGILEALV